MAIAGIRLDLNSPDLVEVRESLRNLFSKKELAPILGDAIEKAIWPAFLRLGEVTPFGATGNLRRAVNHKVKTYPRDGGAVGLVGYNRSGKQDATEMTPGGVQLGPDRAFHQWFVEHGTKRRIVKKVANTPYQRKSKLGNVHWVSGQNSVIASSQSRYGEFRIIKNPDGTFYTDPKYQKAFFKKAKKGEQLVIEPTPKGGIAGQPPVETAWRDSQSKVAFILQQELRISLEKAFSSLTYTPNGTVSGTT